MKVGDRVRIVNSGDSFDGWVGEIHSEGYYNNSFDVALDEDTVLSRMFDVDELESLETAAPEGPTISVRSTIVVRFETLDGFDEYDLTYAEADTLLSNLMAVL